MDDVAIAEMLRHALGHFPAKLGEVVVGESSVEQPRGVVHLSMTYEMHNRPVLNHPAPPSAIPKRSRLRPPRQGSPRQSDPLLYHRAPRKGTKLHTHSAADRHLRRAWNGRTLRRQRRTAVWR